MIYYTFISNYIFYTIWFGVSVKFYLDTLYKEIKENEDQNENYGDFVSDDSD